MSKIQSAIYEIHHIDNISSRNQWVNQLHPLIKFIVTIVYIAVVVSFSKYDIIGLAGMVIYPFVLFQLAELSVLDSLKRLRLVLPLVCIIGIVNPIFDHTTVAVGGTVISAGIFSMLTLMMKGIFCVLASYLLIASTSMERLCYAFRLIHVPKILVTQLLLTYRYITVLLGEVNRITQAYSLRAPKQKGVHFKVWGSLTGQLLLRSIDRANLVYESMILRGYTGEFQYIGNAVHLRAADVGYGVVWVICFALFRTYPLFLLVGNLAGGLFT